MEFLNGVGETFELASRDESLDIRVMEDCVSRMRNYRSGELDEFELGDVTKALVRRWKTF